MVADYSHYGSLHGEPLEASGTRELLSLNNGFSKPQKIRYQVIKDPKEIKDCLHLRYITYRYVNFIEENKDHIDIDSYDLFSTFLGAYNVTGGRKTLVGTIRIISGDEKGEASPHIEKLIRTARDPKIKSLGKRTRTFPIMESFTLPDSYLDYFDKSKAQKSSIHPYEISRLAIRPDYWMYGIDVGLHHLLILDSWLQHSPRNYFLIAVHPRSRRRYKMIGFKVIPETSVVLYKRINQLAIAMIIDLEKYLQQPRSYRETCESFLPDFKKNGCFNRMLEKRTQLNVNNHGHI